MIKKMLNPVAMATAVMIVYIIMPIFSVFISSYLSTYSYMLMCVALFTFILLAGGVDRLSRMVYLLFPLGLNITFTFFTQNDSIIMLGYKGLLMLLTVAAGYYYLYYRSYAVPEFSKIIIFALIVTAITTILGIIRFPEAARTLATIQTSDDAQNLLFSWNNIGGYDFVYTCVLLYPILILAYKKRRISRTAFLVGFLLLFTLVILAEYTIALLLFMISSVLYFAGKRTSPRQLFIFGIVMSVIVFLFQPDFERFLLWLADILNSKIFSERLTALAGGISGLESSESNRIELYKVSLSAFVKSPIFGSLFEQKMVGGGHSFILDTLANYGILGGATIVLLYKNVYKYFFAVFKNEQGYGFVLWAFTQAIILSTVNTGIWLNVLALFAPIFLSSIYNTYGEGSYETSLDY